MRNNTPEKPPNRGFFLALNVLKVVAVYVLVIGVVFGGLYGYGTFMELWKAQSEEQQIMKVNKEYYTSRQIDDEQILNESVRLARRKSEHAYIELENPVNDSEGIVEKLKKLKKKRVFWTHGTYLPAEPDKEEEEESFDDNSKPEDDDTNQQLAIKLQNILKNKNLKESEIEEYWKENSDDKNEIIKIILAKSLELTNSLEDPIKGLFDLLQILERLEKTFSIENFFNQFDVKTIEEMWNYSETHLDESKSVQCFIFTWLLKNKDMDYIKELPFNFLLLDKDKKIIDVWKCAKKFVPQDEFPETSDFAFFRPEEENGPIKILVREPDKIELSNVDDALVWFDKQKDLIEHGIISISKRFELYGVNKYCDFLKSTLLQLEMFVKATKLNADSPEDLYESWARFVRGSFPKLQTMRDTDMKYLIAMKEKTEFELNGEKMYYNSEQRSYYATISSNLNEEFDKISQMFLYIYGQFHDLDFIISKKKSRLWNLVEVVDDDCFKPYTDYNLNDLEDKKDVKIGVGATLECQKLCKDYEECKFFTVYPKEGWCWLKNSSAGERSLLESIAGPKVCPRNQFLNWIPDFYEEITGNGKEKAVKEYEDSALKDFYEDIPSYDTENRKVPTIFFLMNDEHPANQKITDCMQLCLHIPTCWGFYYQHHKLYCIFVEDIENEPGKDQSQYVQPSVLYRRKAHSLDATVTMKNNDEKDLLSNFKIVMDTEKHKMISNKILAEDTKITLKPQHEKSFLSKGEPIYAEQNMEAFISKIVTCAGVGDTYTMEKKTKIDIQCTQNEVPLVINFMAPEGIDINFKVTSNETTTTHFISTKNSQEFWSSLPFEANYEVNILASPNDYECTDMLKKGTLQNNQEVKIDFTCTKIMKTDENSATSRKGLTHMDFMYLFLIAVGIVTILFIVGACAYLHLNKRKNEADENNLILVSKVTDIEDARQNAQSNYQKAKKKLIQTKKKLKETKKDFKELKHFSENQYEVDELELEQKKEKRKKKKKKEGTNWFTTLFA